MKGMITPWDYRFLSQKIPGMDRLFVGLRGALSLMESGYSIAFVKTTW
jgi:hypothetical protein